VNLVTFFKSNIKQFLKENLTFTWLLSTGKQRKKHHKTKHYEQYIQRINSGLRCQQIRQWLFWHYHRFCNYLVAIGAMQLKN
jgi:hypothetical protein